MFSGVPQAREHLLRPSQDVAHVHLGEVGLHDIPKGEHCQDLHTIRDSTGHVLHLVKGQAVYIALLLCTQSYDTRVYAVQAVFAR